jgi:hypothetical protein
MSIELSTDLETNLRGEAAARGIPVDALLHEALALYRRQENGATVQVRRVEHTDRTAEMSWFAHPDPMFIGKWVVLDRDRVLAGGSTAKEVYDQAKSQGVDVPFIAYVSPRRDESFAGGWLD